MTQRVWLEFEVDGRPTGSVTVGLFGREAPQTCDNFTALGAYVVVCRSGILNSDTHGTHFYGASY